MILLLGGLAALGPLAIDMYLPAFAAIAADLQTDLGSVQLTLSVFLAGIAGAQLLYGPLTDRWGRRGPLLAGLSIYIVAALGCALAPSVEALTGWRLVMALGGAAGMVISRAVVRDRCDAREMVRMFSLLMLIMGVAPILAPSLGGLFLTWWSWRSIFWFMAGFGLLLTVGIYFLLEETWPAEMRSRGGVGLALRTYARLLRDPWFLVHAAIACALSSILFGYISGAPAIFSSHLGLEPRLFSILFGLNAAAFVAAAQGNRWLLRRCSPRQLLVGSTAMIFLAAGGYAATVFAGLDNLWVTEALLISMMASAGIAFPNVGALAMLPFAQTAGSASALQGGFQFGCGAVAGALNGLLYRGTAHPVAIIIACAGLLAAGIAWSTRHWRE